MIGLEEFFHATPLFYVAPVLANFIILVLFFYKLTRIRVNIQKMADYHMRIMGIHKDMDDTLRHIVKWNNIIARMVKVSMELLREHETHVTSITQKADHVIDVVTKISQRANEDHNEYKRLSALNEKESRENKYSEGA